MSNEKPDWQIRWERLDPISKLDCIKHMKVQPVEMLLKHWLIRSLCFPYFFLEHYRICRETFPIIPSLKFGLGWTKVFLFPERITKGQ